MITIENIIKTLKEQGVSDDKIEEVNKSFLLASEIHKDQYRQSGEPYITHPLNVAKNLLDMEVYDTELSDEEMEYLLAISKQRKRKKFGRSI